MVRGNLQGTCIKSKTMSQDLRRMSSSPSEWPADLCKSIRNNPFVLHVQSDAGACVPRVGAPPRNSAQLFPSVSAGRILDHEIYICAMYTICFNVCIDNLDERESPQQGWGSRYFWSDERWCGSHSHAASRTSQTRVLPARWCAWHRLFLCENVKIQAGTRHLPCGVGSARVHAAALVG